MICDFLQEDAKELTEDEANFVPAEILEEEERLRKKREGENKEALKVLTTAALILGLTLSRVQILQSLDCIYGWGL